MAHPEAEAELESAIDYLLQHAGSDVAITYIDAIDHATAQIVEAPNSWQVYFDVPAEPAIRKKGVRKFTYNIFYQPREYVIWFLAYANTKRRPNYWADRLKTFIPQP